MRAIDQELQDYVTILNEEQKKTVLKVVQALAPAAANENDWEDENFIAEIDKQTNRYKNYGSGAATSPSAGRTTSPGSRN